MPYHSKLFVGAKKITIIKWKLFHEFIITWLEYLQKIGTKYKL